MTDLDRLRLCFVLEQTLGHVTHSQNLQRLLALDDRVELHVAEIEYSARGNWTVTAGRQARRHLRSHVRGQRPDAVFVHTQVPAILAADLLARLPSVVSLDATPIQYDQLGAHYGHQVRSSFVERPKRWANQLAFRAANHLVAWSEWTKRGLIADYGVPAEKISVIPPGVDVEMWSRVEPRREDDGPVRVLFVGGDLRRKGGDLLIEAVRKLRASGSEIEVDVVTREHVADEPGVRGHVGLGPNDAALIELYRAADIFCLPTLGDCLPMVLSEAGALGLPLVSTDVGAISEIVVADETGLLVRPGDAIALAAALERLVEDGEMRRRLGAKASELVRSKFDAAANARRLVDLLVAAAAR